MSVRDKTERTKYEIVLDVPLTATNLAYGALVSGGGTIWFDSISFEEVDETIPTTGEDQQKYMPVKEPSNLSFEE